MQQADLRVQMAGWLQGQVRNNGKIGKTNLTYLKTENLNELHI